MADDPQAANTVTPAIRNRSAVQGDVPDALTRRYYVDGRGGAGLGFYVDARIERPAFRDEGRKLASARTDPNAIRDMALIARHRGWSIVTVRGTAEFRREAWLAGRTLGIEVRGHRPTERDIQELDRRIDRRNAARDRSQRARDRPDDERSEIEPADRERRRAANGRDQLRIVEAVARNRLEDPSAQARILAAAHARVADWLKRGARFERVLPSERAQTPSQDRQRERSR
jgi:hypothetical protein